MVGVVSHGFTNTTSKVCVSEAHGEAVEISNPVYVV